MRLITEKWRTIEPIAILFLILDDTTRRGVTMVIQVVDTTCATVPVLSNVVRSIGHYTEEEKGMKKEEVWKKKKDEEGTQKRQRRQERNDEKLKLQDWRSLYANQVCREKIISKDCI